MFICKNCSQIISDCPHCRQPINDRMSSFLYQLAAIIFFISIIIFLLEIKVKDQITMAMRPFNITEEANKKKGQVEAAKTPGGKVKADTTLDKAKEDKKKENSKSNSSSSQKADFKVGIWGMDKEKIQEKEKDTQLHFLDVPTILDYSSNLGNYAVISQYRFSSGRLISGSYILFGEKIKLSSDKIKNTRISIGESTPGWVHRDIALYKKPRNKSLNSLKSIKAFYSEIYLSLVSQFGQPENINTVNSGKKIPDSEIVESVIARERFIKYFWKRKRSIVELFFACGEKTPYFKISYTDRKVIGWLK